MRVASKVGSNCSTTVVIVSVKSGCDFPMTLIGKSHGNSNRDSFTGLMSRLSLLLLAEHEQERIPNAPADARLRYGGKRDHGELRERLAVGDDLDRAHRLAVRE